MDGCTQKSDTLAVLKAIKPVRLYKIKWPLALEAILYGTTTSMISYTHAPYQLENEAGGVLSKARRICTRRSVRDLTSAYRLTNIGLLDLCFGKALESARPERDSPASGWRAP